VIASGLVCSGRGTARAEDAQGKPTQSHISPIVLVYEDEVSLSLLESAASSTGRGFWRDQALFRSKLTNVYHTKRL